MIEVIVPAQPVKPAKRKTRAPEVDPLGDPEAIFQENMKDYLLGDWPYRQNTKGAPERLMLAMMAADLVKVDGEYRCYLSLEELDRLCGLRSARRILKRLEDKGLIVYRKGPHPDTGAICRYHVLLADTGR